MGDTRRFHNKTAKGYPMPAKLTSLLLSNAETSPDDHVHPRLLEWVSTEGILKMVHYGIWLKSTAKRERLTLDELLHEELRVYEDHYGLKSELQVSTSKLRFYVNSMNVMNFSYLPSRTPSWELTEPLKKPTSHRP